MANRMQEKPEVETLAAADDVPTLGDAEKLDAALAQAPADAASARGNSIAPSIAEQVALVPTDPGCYLWKDAKGNVLYVGKAKKLKNSRPSTWVPLTP